MKLRPFRRGLAHFTFFAVLGWSSRASAEATRVLFVSHDKTPLSERIRAEIEAMGFEVVASDRLEPDGGGDASAAAQVIESPPPRRIELWLRDQGSGHLALDRVLEAEPGAGDPSADATSAVRVSEQLRAFFQPLREGAVAPELMPPRPAPPTLATRTAPPEPAPPPKTATLGGEEGRYFQEIAAALPAQPGSLGLDLLLRARQRFGQTFGVGVKLVVPLVPSTVSSGGNAADVSASLFGVELSALLLTTRLVTFGAHAGVSLLWLSASGQAQPPYTDGVDRAFAALPSVGGELGVRVNEHVRLCLGAELGVAVPKLELAFAGQNVTSWARPLALFSAGVGVAWGKP
ncbi:MAG TPA: hypothetical protein VFK05_04340 [Polyangiaceae bacterium]|nr:hypothetical protein [Polyangiaceae bacterium]